MSFGGQPYVHCPPPRQAGYVPNTNVFDPKAYTRASFTPSTTSHSKHNGSLADFNKHPDSYLILPYGQTNARPMGSNTKRKVNAIRWVQLSLRILNMICALGMLVCVICLTNVEGTEGWVIRLVPAADILLTTYAIYHLARGSRARTPASSASYHWFALLMDLCIIPLYVYVVIVDRATLGEPAGNEDRWRSMFKTEVATTDLLMATWIGSLALGGIHLLCCCNSLYLACTFRKIANLPPDMNPLEDNLTSRRRTKHKHKNSELTLSEKHDSGISFSTSGHNSTAKLPVANERPMSFVGTRTAEATQLYSPHNPVTANASRSHLPMFAQGGMYSQPQFAQVSRVDFATSSSPPKPKSGLSRMFSVAASSIYSRSSNSDATPPLPRKSSKRTSSTFESSNNWYAIHEDGDEDVKDHAPSVSIIEEDSDDNDDNVFVPSRTNSLAQSAPGARYYAQKYHAVPQPSHDGDIGTSTLQYTTSSTPPRNPTYKMKNNLTSAGFETSGLHMDPLHMNPPTPPPGAMSASQRERKQAPRAPTPHNPLRALAPTSGNVTCSPQSNTVTTAQAAVLAPVTVPKSARDQVIPPARDSPSPSKQKTRHYGNLASAVSGVRNTPPSTPSKTRDAPAPTEKTEWGIGAWLAGVGPSGADAGRDENRARNDQHDQDEDGDPFFEDVVLSGPAPSSSSRLGIDESRIREGDARRRVSGKVVEEGLAPSTAQRWGGTGGWGQRGIRVVQPAVSGSPWRREMNGNGIDGRGRVISRSGVDVA